MPMKLIHICPASWGSNCYLVCADGEAFVIDPSPSTDAVMRHAENAGVTVKGILLTHGHFDHVLSISALRTQTGAPVMIHRADAEMLQDGNKNAYCAFFGQDRSFGEADRLLDDGDVLPLGSEKLTVMHTPGHSPGSCCFVADEFIITGDTLFSQGCGRADLWGSNVQQLRDSLSRLSALSRELPIYPGHGISVALGDALSKLRL